MDVRKRVLAARLAVRVNENKKYSKSIGLYDHSDFRFRSKGGGQDVYDNSFLIVDSRIRF